MVQVLASELNCPAERVSVKATTMERMGFTGRGEGIAAFAVVLLRERSED
jgi:2-C-methyl-D-erythritol 2,4-cyclodiphosphate synthase